MDLTSRMPWGGAEDQENAERRASPGLMGYVNTTRGVGICNGRLHMAIRGAPDCYTYPYNKHHDDTDAKHAHPSAANRHHVTPFVLGWPELPSPVNVIAPTPIRIADGPAPSSGAPRLAASDTTPHLVLSVCHVGRSECVASAAAASSNEAEERQTTRRPPGNFALAGYT